MRKLSTNALLISGGEIAALLLGFLATVRLTRVLGTAGYGMVVTGMSVLGYALWFSDLGLTTLGIREMARPAGERRYRLKDFLLIKLSLAVIVFIAAQGIITLLYPAHELQRVVRLYLLSLFSGALLLEWYYQSVRNYGPSTFSKIFSRTVYVVCLYLMVQGTDDIALVPIFYFLSAMLSGVILLLIWRREKPEAPSRISQDRYRSLLKRTPGIGIGGILAQGVQLLPPLAVGYFGSIADAGILGSALTVVSLALVADRVFIALFLPAVSHLWATDRRKLEQQLEMILKIVIVSALSISTVVAIFPENILGLIYGPAYRGGALPLSILSWFIAATLINTPFSYCLIAIGEEKAYFRSTLTSGLLSIVITLTATYLWNLTGAAVAMVVSELVMVGMMYAECRKHFSISIMKPLGVAVVLSALLIAAGNILGTHQLWQIPFVWIAFISLAFLLRGFGREELMLLVNR
jgi:O-antigen/teichoic acid export membrane protein